MSANAAHQQKSTTRGGQSETRYTPDPDEGGETPAKFRGPTLLASVGIDIVMQIDQKSKGWVRRALRNLSGKWPTRREPPRRKTN